MPALYAILFCPGRGTEGPTWATVPEHRIQALRDEGFFLLAKDSDVRFRDVQEVRDSEERRWNPPRWKRHSRTTGE